MKQKIIIIWVLLLANGVARDAFCSEVSSASLCRRYFLEASLVLQGLNVLSLEQVQALKKLAQVYAQEIGKTTPESLQVKLDVDKSIKELMLRTSHSGTPNVNALIKKIFERGVEDALQEIQNQTPARLKEKLEREGLLREQQRQHNLAFVQAKIKTLQEKYDAFDTTEALIKSCYKNEWNQNSVSLEEVRFLAQNAIKIDEARQDTEYKNALMVAVEELNADVVSILIRAGAKVNAPLENDNLSPESISSYGQTVLVQMIKSENLPAIELLVQHGANIDEQSILYAIQNKKRAAFSYLLDLNKNANYENYQVPPLTEVIHRQDLDLAQILLDKNYDINLQEAVLKKTALMVAAESGYSEGLQFLLKNGASLNLRNLIDQTAAMLAEQYGRTDISYLIKLYQTQIP